MRIPSVLVLLLAVPFLGSCETLQDLLAGVTKPTASLQGVALRDLDLESVTLDFDVAVDNPYEVQLPLLGLSYDVKSGANRILEGALPASLNIPARGTGNVDVPVKLRFADVLNLVTGLRPGAVVPYQADLGIQVDLPAGENLNLPLKTEGEFPVPAVPDVRVQGVRLKSLSLDNAEAVLDLDILNTNQFDVLLKDLQYALSLAGTRVAEAGVNPGTELPAGGSGDLSLNLGFSPMKLGNALFNTLRGSETGYSLDGMLGLDTRFGALDLPYSSRGTAPLVR